MNINITSPVSNSRKRKPQFPLPKAKRYKFASSWTNVPRGQAGGTVTRIKQIFSAGTISSVAAADTVGAFVFQLNSLPNNADLKKMYDEYTVDKLRFEFIPNGSNIPCVSGATVASRCILYTAKDYNDNTAPASLNAILEYQTCKYSPYLEKQYRSLKPCALATNPDGTVMGAAGTWVPTSQDTVKWFGLKYGLSANGNSAGTVQTYQVLVTVYLSFKNIQ